MRKDLLVNDEQADLFGWLHARTFLPRSEDFRAVGRIVNNNIVGVFGYDRHLPGASCQIHVAGDGPRWLNRALLWKAFHVPFAEWGYRVLVAPIASDNQESLRLAAGLGFLHHATIPEAHADGDLHLWTMTRAQGAKWLNVKYRN